MQTTNKCIACGSKQGEQSVSLFRFPRNAERCRQWIEISGLTQLHNVPVSAVYEKYRLCSLHFDSTQFRLCRSTDNLRSTDNQQKKLIRNALPTLFNGVNSGRKLARSRKDWAKSAKSLHILAANLCRLCATVSDDLIEVFGEEGQRLDLCNKIHTHLPIMVTEHDILPTSCCCSCISKLELCHNFAVSCLDANSKLYSILRLPKPSDNEAADSLLIPEQNSESNETANVEQLSSDSVEFDTSETIQWKRSVSDLFGDDCNLENKIVSGLWNRDASADDTAGKEENFVNEVPAHKTSISQYKENEDFENEISVRSSSGCVIRNKLKKSRKLKKIITDPDSEDILLPKIAKTESLACHAAKKVNHRNWNIHRGPSKISSTKCNICKLQFINVKRLRSHIAVIHKNLNFKCRHCGKLFRHQNNLRRHVAVHRMTYTCKFCFESLPTYQLMLSHRKFHVGIDANIVAVSECDVGSESNVTNNKNINSGDLQSGTVEETSELPVSDTAEDRSESPDAANTRTDLETEDNLVQPLSLSRSVDVADCLLSSNEVTVANETDITFADSSKTSNIQEPVVDRPLVNIVTSLSHSNIDLRTHIIEEPEIAEAVNSIKEDSLPYENQMCQVEYDQSYVNASGVHEIVAIIDSEASNNSNELYHCSSCNKIFTTEFAYRTHISKHSTEKKFICDTCDRPFAHQWALDSHLRIHSDEKPFACSFCGDKFLFKRSLVVHERNHAENKSFKCNVCEKYFNSLTKLKQHLISHSDDWPFKCTFCPREFRRREALKYHISKHKDECKLCKRKPGLKENEGSGTQEISRMRTEGTVSSENCVIFGEFGSSEVVIESHADAVPVLHDSNVACEYVI